MMCVPPNLREWHVWFAWHPVWIWHIEPERYVWLRFIERKWVESEHIELGFWDYRT